MRLTILGSGTCASQIKGIKNRFPPAFLVEGKNNEKILFECSEGIRFRLEKAGYDYANIAHIAISHSHPDHFALVHYLQSLFCKRQSANNEEFDSRELHIYCPKQIAGNFSSLSTLYAQDFNGEESFAPKIYFHSMTDSRNFVSIGKLKNKLYASDVFHGFGKVDALAFRLETEEGTFVYSGDTGDCEAIRSVASDADLFVCEVSARIGDGISPYQYGHLNPFIAGDIAFKSNVKILVLFHYSGFDSDEDLIKECRRSGFCGEIIIGKDFQVVDF